MRVGVALPHGVNGGIDPLDWPQLADLAVRLETAGFDSLWVSDHFFTDLSVLGGPAGAAGQLDAMVLLPALAVVTKRVQLGTLVLAVGFRPPSVLAKAAASLDRLSEGRMVLGLGAGWHEAEYAAAGLDFPSGRVRLAELEEAVILIREMTTHRRATYAGQHFHAEQAPNLPPASQPALPILVAGAGPQALRTAARTADVWNVAWRFPPQAYAAKAAEFEQACEAVGRDPGEVQRSLGLRALVGENDRDVRLRFEEWRQQAPWLFKDLEVADVTDHGLIGTTEQVKERIEEYRALGVTELVLSFSPLPFGWSSAAGWDMVAEEILPAYREAAR